MTQTTKECLWIVAFALYVLIMMSLAEYFKQ